MTKSQQRQLMKRQLKKIAPMAAHDASERIISMLQSMPEFLQSKKILFYNPFPHRLGQEEPNLLPLLEKINLAEKVIGFPSLNDLLRIELFQIQELNQLVLHPFGLLQPDARKAASVPVEAFDFILVPGLAFDRRGVRLGRGGGYYDRLLSRARPEAHRVGCFFSSQELPSIQKEPHDQLLSWIVTEKEIYQVASP